MVLDKSFPLLWPQSPPPPPMPHPQPGHSCWCVCLGTAACLPGRPLTAVEVEDLQTLRDVWPMETRVSALLSLPALSPWSGRALDLGLRILGTMFLQGPGSFSLEGQWGAGGWEAFVSGNFLCLSWPLSRPHFSILPSFSLLSPLISLSRPLSGLTCSPPNSRGGE